MYCSKHLTVLNSRGCDCRPLSIDELDNAGYKMAAHAKYNRMNGRAFHVDLTNGKGERTSTR